MARNAYKRMTASGQVSPGAATIRTIVVTPGTVAATVITLYDDPSAATGGREIMTLKYAVGSDSRDIPLHGLTTARGLWVTMTGTGTEVVFELA